jgi:hypothetical protein
MEEPFPEAHILDLHIRRPAEPKSPDNPAPWPITGPACRGVPYEDALTLIGKGRRRGSEPTALEGELYCARGRFRTTRRTEIL